MLTVDGKVILFKAVPLTTLISLILLIVGLIIRFKVICSII